MLKFNSIFDTKNPIIGMIHVQALPGTPNYQFSPQQIIDEALNEARVYKDSGIDGIMIENMHDVPYLNKKVGHEISSLMGIIAYLIKNEVNLPVGIQILAGANIPAMATANSASIDFIRAEGFVFGHLADEGYIDAGAAELLRYRSKIMADEIAVFTDIKKKHSSHTITNDVSLLDTAKAAEFFLSDGVIITGSHTGEAASIDDLDILKNQLKIPVIIGSGVTIDNVLNYLDLCDAMIVGSHFKTHGFWKNKLSTERVLRFMDLVNLNRN